MIIIYLVLFGLPYRGVKRWIFINGFSYQPSEFLKISFPVVLSQFLNSKKWFTAILLCSTLLLLLLLQPDIGNSILLFVTSLSIAFFWGIRKRFLLTLMLLGCSFLGYSSLKVGYSAKRIKSFMHHGNANLSYQSFRAIQAIEAGKLTGIGPNKGTIKRFIPDAYSDFIFAVIGEEFGFIGCSLIAASFLLFFLSCLFFSSINPASVEGGSIFGVGAVIFLQAWIHMASVVGIIPTKGITLPFISHGSSSMMASWLGLAIILSMSRNIKPYQKLDNVINICS